MFQWNRVLECYRSPEFTCLNLPSSVPEVKTTPDVRYYSGVLLELVCHFTFTPTRGLRTEPFSQLEGIGVK